VIRALLLLAHVAAAAVRLGGMGYSPAIVRPRARRTAFTPLMRSHELAPPRVCFT
jgi:hypothetical protein